LETLDKGYATVISSNHWESYDPIALNERNESGQGGRGRSKMGEKDVCQGGFDVAGCNNSIIFGIAARTAKVSLVPRLSCGNWWEQKPNGALDRCAGWEEVSQDLSSSLGRLTVESQ
jgi:hypothetical protein